MGLRIENLQFAYPGWEPTLRGASLEVPAGQSGFLLGPSGCGKSTLLRCVAGLETSYQGTVQWDGTTLDGQPPHERRVGLLFQEPALFPHLNVWQNVAFGLQYRGIAKRDWRREAENWLDVVHMGDRQENAVDQLSGGQRQRVALARTLAAKPRVVLLDEPLSALDRELRDRLGPEIKELLAKQGVAALWVTHDREEAMRLGDRVWRMVDGRCQAVQDQETAKSP